MENAQQPEMASVSESEIEVVRERYVAFHSIATQILPDVQAMMPTEAPALQTEIRRLEQGLNTTGRKPPGPPQPIPDAPAVQASVDRLVDYAARSSNVQTRDGVYAKAAVRLYVNGEYERAIDVAGKIENSALSLSLTEPCKVSRAMQLTARGELDGAGAIARGIESTELRAAVFTRLANAFFASKKRAPGAEFLGEAQLAAAKTPPSIYLASILLGIAQVVLENDTERASQAIYEAVRVANGIKEGNPWEILPAGIGLSGSSLAQNPSWTNRKDGGIESFKVVYPRIAGITEVISKVSETDPGEGLQIARQLKWRGESMALQAAICRQSLERAQAMLKTTKVPPKVKTHSNQVHY
jgi:hypothetical protein